MQLLAGDHQLAEFFVVELALTDLVRVERGAVGENTARQLLGRHFEGEERHDGAFGGLLLARRADLVFQSLGGIEGDVGGERGLAHRGASGQDQEIRAVQAAQLAVEVAQAAGDARQLALALMGQFGLADRLDQDVLEALEAALGLA